MKEELNIAAILKDKPKGTKLWSPVTGDCTFKGLRQDDSINVFFPILGNTVLSKEGTFFNGETIIFPSKEMQDWGKFAWKKGDVLTDEERFVIFKGFNTDDYTEFSAPFEYEGESFRQDLWFITNDFRKVSDNIAQEVIKKIEEYYGGKLNLETLQIEKPKLEFKDGDIITLHKKNCDTVFILNRWKTEDSFYYYAFHTCNTGSTGIIDKGIRLPYEWSYVDGKLSLATDTEKQLLFSALAKENKKWDAEKKMLVDLPKKCEFKVFKQVLVRDLITEKWRPAFFVRMREEDDSEYIYKCLSLETAESCGFRYCIPYNDQTKHLLGTTDEWKGGEG